MIDAGEFRFLQDDALRVGRKSPLPAVRRISLPVSQQRQVSALRFYPDQNPRFVFLHGMGLNAHDFDPVILALDEPAISIDLPGHGQSDWRDDNDYSPERLAEDVSTSLRLLTTESFTLIGHSLGGLTAAVVGAQLPKQVEQLIILDITPSIQPKIDTDNVTEFISGQRVFSSHEEIVERAVAFKIGHDSESLRRGIALNTRLRSDGHWEWAHHFAHMDPLSPPASNPARPFVTIWQALRQARALDVPVSLIRGDNGFVDDTQLSDWLHHLPDSVVRDMPGNHNLHESAPVELAQQIQSVCYG